METLKIFGERLRALRDERHLRQADMAEVLQITLVHYQRMEYGKVNVPSLTLCFLADYFSVTTDYLLRQDGGQTAAAQPRNNGGRSGTGRRESRDFIDRMGYLAKTKGYLLGWVLVVWGALDLLLLLLMGMGVLGMLTMW